MNSTPKNPAPENTASLATQPSAAASKNSSARLDEFIRRVVQLYGDMIFDLCESVLWSPANAQITFRAILKDLRKTRSSNAFQVHERAWILRVTCNRLGAYAQRYGRKLTPSEQIMLDATLNVQARFKQFDSYFHRLSTEDQMLLILRDKYGLPYPEIASAMNCPEGSLKIKRQQALRTLEEWLWDRK